MPLKRASGDVTKEDTVSVEAALQRLLRREATELKRRSQPRAARYRCPMCPFRVLWRSSGREEHDDKHTEENSYVLSMRQLALIKSMFDVDIVHGTVKGDYLQRSARMMRATVLPRPPNSLNNVDRDMILVQGSDGPFYANRNATADFRKIGQRIFYTRRMADRMYRDMIYYTGQVGPIMDRFIMDLAVAGNTAYELIYKMKVTWLKIF